MNTTLTDIERGAEAYIKKYQRKIPLSRLEQLACDLYLEHALGAAENEAYLDIFAKLLTNDTRGALDSLEKAITPPEEDEIDVLERLRDERGDLIADERRVEGEI